MEHLEPSLRASLGRIAAGASLDESLRAVGDQVVGRCGFAACKIWLVKQGDMCAICAFASACPDRTLCLHLRVSVPGREAESPRVPLVIFRDRLAARGGIAHLDPKTPAGRLLFEAEAAHGPRGSMLALLPLRGPSGVLGLLGALGERPLSQADLDALNALADLAVVAVRIADLTSRHERASLGLEENAGERAEIGALLHAILYGSTEYDVIAEDLDGNITVFSEGARTTYGYGPEEVIGRAKSDILYAPEEIESGRIVEILDEAMKTGRCEAIVTRLRKNGERFPARATFTIRRDVDGDPAGFVIVERDLSAERTSARLTATAAQQVAQLQEHLHDLRSSYAALEDLATIRASTIVGLKKRVAALERKLREAAPGRPREAP